MKKMLSLTYLSITICFTQATCKSYKKIKTCRAERNTSIATPQIAPFYKATYPFTVPKLPYAFDALEPYIDKKTMEVHHNKHHQGYVNNLNNALKGHKDLHNKTLFELLSNLNKLPHEARAAIRNHGGGHFNHSLFWTVMTPNAQQRPSGKLAEKINETFGSFETMQDEFNKKAKTVFGSGWAWLVTDKKGNLSVLATHNQDSPLEENLIPILGLDVWEHAYYLKYQNKRGDYISAWWHIINWPTVQRYYSKAIKA